MVCSKCGKEFSDGGFCPACGQAADPAQNSASASNAGGGAVNNFQNRFSGSGEDDMQLSVGGKNLAFSLIYKIIAIAVAVLFFLPCVRTVEIFGISISASAFELAKGTSDFDGNIVWFLDLVIAICLFAAFQFKDKFKFLEGKLFQSVTSLCGAGLLSGIYCLIDTDTDFVKFTIVFWLTMILYIIGIVLAIFGRKAIEK